MPFMCSDASAFYARTFPVSGARARVALLWSVGWWRASLLSSQSWALHLAFPFLLSLFSLTFLLRAYWVFARSCARNVCHLWSFTSVFFPPEIVGLLGAQINKCANISFLLLPLSVFCPGGARARARPLVISCGRPKTDQSESSSHDEENSARTSSHWTNNSKNNSSSKLVL